MQALSEARIGAERCALIPNGVRAAVAAGEGRAETRRAWLGEAAGPVVLYVGRIEEVKGVRALLGMWGAMPHPDGATLLIVGDGPLRRELEGEAVARALGLSVRFLGNQPDVSPFYLIADVFVLPSVTEGLSNALLEAMAAGLPVVASDVGGNREVVEHGASGFLVDWTDPRAPARLVTRLLRDAPLRTRIGEAARRRAACYSIAAVGERYCQLYQRLGSAQVPQPEVAG
jgi:glycosyltransferase involved in cell wall biosynthesis